MRSGKRCCVFVDGENLRHGIVDLFPEFDKRDHLPKSADWTRFFDMLVERACPGGERLRTYWYVVDLLEFFPHRFPEEPDKLLRLLMRDPARAARLAGLAGEERDAECRAMARKCDEYRATMQRRFDGWRVLHAGIARQHRSVEFRRAGTIRYSLFDGTLGTEKAVDVKLATDMIVLREIYDAAVIVSGDQDYVPAVQVVKDSGNTVVNVAFERRNGDLHPGGARKLNEMTDHSIRVSHAELKALLGLPPAGAQA